jgi:hypothetical protein
MMDVFQKPNPPRQVRQEVWDAAATLADHGFALPAIVSKVMEAAGPQIEAQSVLEIPPHGRTFWASMAKALAWGLAADLGLLVAESVGARPVPAVKLTIYLGVVIWSLVFGVVAANNKVRQRRVRLSNENRALVERLAQEAARFVWSSEVPGDWRPLGPSPEGLAAIDETVPTAWLRRFGVATGQMVGALSDGSEQSLRRSIRSARGLPVAAFVAEPGVFADPARRLADDCGVALFTVGGAGLHPMSEVASATLDAYGDRHTVESPAGQLLSGWARAGPTRSAQLQNTR